MKKISGLFLLICLAGALLSLSCVKHSHIFIKHSFYYWKTVFDISPQDREIFEKLDVKRIYLRFFDVVFSEKTGTAVSEKKVDFRGGTAGYEVVPVVFMMPDSISKTETNKLDGLAESVIGLVRKMAADNNIKISELQIDYDWVPSTREKYFGFLKLLKKKMIKNDPSMSLSVTIRLHQVKYSKITGVPPADSFFLMAYNTGNINVFSEEAVMFNLKALRSYTGAANRYPQAVNVILPVFPSFYVYEGGRIKGIVTDIDDEKLKDRDCFIRKNGFRYVCRKNFNYRGYNFRIGQLIKIERVTINDLVKALDILSTRMNLTGEISLYHYDKKFLAEVTDKKISRLDAAFNY